MLKLFEQAPRLEKQELPEEIEAAIEANWDSPLGDYQLSAAEKDYWLDKYFEFKANFHKIIV